MLKLFNTNKNGAKARRLTIPSNPIMNKIKNIDVACIVSNPNCFPTKKATVWDRNLTTLNTAKITMDMARFLRKNLLAFEKNPLADIFDLIAEFERAIRPEKMYDMIANEIIVKKTSQEVMETEVVRE